MAPNADVVRRLTEAFNRGDREGLFSFTTTDVEVVEAPNYPGATTRHGHAGMKETLDSWSQAWGALAVEIDELIELDDEQVLMVGRQHVRGGSGGVELDAPIACLYRLRDGQIAAMRFFLDVDEARANAAGKPA
jgi:ketosteroid isomerase-like protein